MSLLRSNKWKLSFRVLPFVCVIILLKLVVHQLGYEFLTLNTLFGAIISANIFLISFLISGVLTDYKEAEKIPADISSSLEALADETHIIYKNKKSKTAKDFLIYIKDLNNSILKWFNKKERTFAVLNKITGMNDYFLAFEKLTQANFIARMKNDQSNLRKLINRTHTIRETSFNPAGYAIAEIISAILCIGFIFIKINPYYESIFFVGFVSFILIYMVMLIRDLDNPFGYYEKENYADEVSLKPLFDLKKRLK